jgi:hypothetical protein
MKRYKHNRRDRLPPGVRLVARPSRWANPFKISPRLDRPEAIASFRRYAEERLAREPGWLDPLRAASGLACYCKLDEACHADVLIEMIEATAGTRGGAGGG